MRKKLTWTKTSTGNYTTTLSRKRKINIKRQKNGDWKVFKNGKPCIGFQMTQRTLWEAQEAVLICMQP